MRPLARRTDARGQALVEFALVLPLILMLLLGILEFGRAWNEHQVVTDAARAGARLAALADPNITSDSVQAVVAQSLANAGIAPVTATLDPAQPNNAASGTPVTVQIGVPYEFFLLGPLLRWTTTAERVVTLSARATMRKE